MSSHDSFTFPKFLPLGLIVRPYGGVKAEPPNVKVEEDLPRRFMFGCLQKGSFTRTQSGWSASYRHPTIETRAEVAYNDALEVNFSWRGEKWMATAPEQTFTDVHLCIYPESLDKAMKERLEEHYNLAYSIPNEKIGRDCYFPDGPSRCIVCPIRLSSLGIARKALHAMEQDGTIVAPLFAFAVMGARHGVPVPMRARPLPSPNDVKVEGKDLKAGTYALFLDVEKAGPWVWIFSKHLGWGSFQYDPKDDALRVPVTPQDGPFTEFLTYGFDERLPHSAVAYLRWEKKRIPFKIEVPNVNELYVAKIRQELQSWPGFNYQDWQTAAQAYSIYAYGMGLLRKDKKSKAMEIFTFNRQQHSDEKFWTSLGLARGYTTLEDKKNAIANWEVVLQNIPANFEQPKRRVRGRLEEAERIQLRVNLA